MRLEYNLLWKRLRIIAVIVELLHDSSWLPFCAQWTHRVQKRPRSIAAKKKSDIDIDLAESCLQLLFFCYSQQMQRSVFLQ
jgi:hypothetical protein